MRDREAFILFVVSRGDTGFFGCFENVFMMKSRGGRWFWEEFFSYFYLVFRIGGVTSSLYLLVCFFGVFFFRSFIIFVEVFIVVLLFSMYYFGDSKRWYKISLGINEYKF